MPTYQRAHLIGESIDSCYAQTFQNFEIVVVDDGSTDETARVVAQYDSRTRYHRLPGNSGPAKARNEAVRLAQGEYVAMLDSDDLWYPEKLQKQLALFQQKPQLGWVYCDLKFFGCSYAENLPPYFTNKKPARGMVLINLLCDLYPMMTPTIMVRRSCFQAIGGYDESLRTAEDTDLYNRLAQAYEVDFVNEVLVQVRRLETDNFSVTGKSAEHHLRVIERVLQYQPSVLAQMSRDQINRSFVRLCNRAAQLYRQEGALADWRRMLRRAWRYNPLNLAVYRSLLASFFKRG